MTRQLAHIKKAERPRLGLFCLAFLLVFSLALLLRRADVARDCMRQGLSICARSVVPSLFPFMVLSELLVASGAGEWFFSPLCRPLGKLLGLSRAGCCAVVLGLLCGFPVGARCAILAYEKGAMQKNECERVIACSSIPSSAFLISTVGTTLWNDTRFGTLLYVTSVLMALFCGFLLYVLQKRKEKGSAQAILSPPTKMHFEAGAFPSAIRNATANTLLICAYVVFFSTLTGAVELVLGRFAASQEMHAILSSLLELSGGVNASAELADRRLAAIVTGAAVGWSGVSIHCQMLSLCDGKDLSLRPYFASKLLQTVGCALVAALL